MAGRISALEPQKRSRDRINVYLDGEFAFGLADVEAVRLRVGQELSDIEIAGLKATDELKRAHEKSLDFLTYRPRSEAELRRYLRKHQFSVPVVDEVLERLKRAELVNDETFTSFWVENRTRFRPRGRRALVQELRQKGVPAPFIDTALATYDEEKAAERCAHQQARRLMHLPPQQFQKRLSQRLARRGFPYEIIRDIVARYSSPDSNIIIESEEY
ncbi:MAG: RecX family transcriptional regulator [Anaerolineae bacterium]|nr:RecX family transcriptional regulator [Anaerolineae bacterium]